MVGIKTPQNIKDVFYKTYNVTDNYKKLIVKDNEITKDLKTLYKNNIWDLSDKCEKLEVINKAENKNFYNSWINQIYLLDYKRVQKFKTIKVIDFFNLRYKGDQTERNEKNYISHFKTWINNFFIDQAKEENLKWFCINQNQVLLTLFKARNTRKNSLETFRKDINLLLHILKISEADDEIINRYKMLNMNLSLITKMQESNNEIDETEKYIDYNELLKLQNNLYNN